MRKRIKAIKWDEGISSVIFFICMAWLMVLSIAFFVENYNAYSKVGKTQILADLVADGGCFIGDTGWGLSESNAKEAVKKLKEKNSKYFEEISVPSSGKTETARDYIDIYVSDERGNRISAEHNFDNGEDYKNTVSITSKLKGKTLTTNQKLTAEKNGTTRIAYTGGLKIVREAWHYSYEYKHDLDATTPYLWGGGHESKDLGCLSTGADCSGFVSAIFRKCGYESIWGCTFDLEDCGKFVSSNFDDARPGDIILYWYYGDVADHHSKHVAIYAGKHNGVHYQIESHGGTTNSIPVKNEVDKGVHLNPVNTSASRVMIRRIVNSEGMGEEVPETTIGNLNRNETIIYMMLSEAGYLDPAIKGIMGNLSLEGQCSPITREGHPDRDGTDPVNLAYAYGIRSGTISREQFIRVGLDGNTGYGIAQWTTAFENKSGEGDRKAKLWDYANQIGSDVTSLETQVRFLIGEMNDIYGLTPMRMNSLSVQEAAFVFFKYFEGGGEVLDGSYGERKKRAEQFDFGRSTPDIKPRNLPWLL